MATIAFDGDDTGQAARPPISAHPAFPAIVALWFAALLGLGSMVLPAALLERALLATGLASLVPALAPPLDLPGRGLIAIAAALAGAMVGLAVARRVAAAQAPEPAPRFSQVVSSMPPRPISVREELGGEGVVNGMGMPVTRRRALAISEDDRPSDFLYTAPLPGEDQCSPPVPATPAEMACDEPLELSEALLEPEIEAVEGIAPDNSASDEDPPMTDRQEFQPIANDASDAVPAAEPETAGHKGEVSIEPLPFAAPSLSRRLDHHRLPELEQRDDVRLASENATPEPAAERADWTSAPPESLGLVQLVQRLGRSIERRREWLAETAATTPAAPLRGVPDAFEPAPAEEAAQAMADYFGRPDSAAAAVEDVPAERYAAVAPVEAALLGMPQTVAAVPRPAFLQPFAAEAGNEDDAGDMPDFSLPLRSAGDPAPSVDSIAGDPDSDGADDAADSDDDTSFGSLLAMRNPFAGKHDEFVRIEEPESDGIEPAVKFPETVPLPVAEAQDAQMPAPRLFDAPGKAAPQASGMPQPKPADADAALRGALATLQRMNGAT